MSSDQRSTEVVAMASSSKGAKASISKGAVIAANEMMELETDSGGGTRSNSLAKREY
jgi:hypothetical protein